MLQGKQGIVFGVANKRSIAWATAQALAGAGARLALTYQNERLRENVEELAQTINGTLTLQCDVTRTEEVDQTFARLRQEFGRLDFLIHSIAYAPREALEGAYLDTSREAFLTALDISAYSLTELARAAAPLMTDGGSIVTMTYYGAEKVVPNYNVMGVAKAALEASTRYLAAELGPRNIRVNAISAGPIQTLAARGIGNLNVMLKHHAERSPLRRNVEAREVANVALFLCSPLATGITGEVIHVDCGYNIMGF
ncbi:MAG: NADH-specific enoyl-ACP reductase [Pyrinomonas sp.]|uniref:enoyl-ACP reductase FabI n=1 Tax=Pyrinomonas sp. TaxID=2080306 RepID=UPI003326DF36